MSAPTQLVPGGEPVAECGYPAGFVHDFSVLFDRLRTRSFSRSGLVGTVVQPLVFFAIFYCTFASMLEDKDIDFGRFVTPTVIVQALMFVAISSATELSADRTSRFFARLLTSPIDVRAMSLAHLAVVALQGAASTSIIVGVGYVVGFRFEHGVPAALGFFVLAVAFGISLSLATATIALRLHNQEALSAVLHLPYLPLLVLSTGFVKVGLFPEWLQPIVIASPVSGVVDALRALSSHPLTGVAVLPGLLWVLAMLVVFSWTTTTAFRKEVLR